MFNTFMLTKNTNKAQQNVFKGLRWPSARASDSESRGTGVQSPQG